MKRALDFARHNAEVRSVWDAYHKRTPIRVPVIFGINPRFTMDLPEANPRSITFEEYTLDPQLMLERQLEHQQWVRQNVPQDAEMGPPADGWHVYVDFQNYYEAAWFGCEVRFAAGQPPDTVPLLADDAHKASILRLPIPDPFTAGWMARNWEYVEFMKHRKEEGFTFAGLPIVDVTPSGLGTDGPMTVACNLRGTTGFLTDLAADKAYARDLLHYITEATIARITAYRKHLGHPLRTRGWGFADDSVQLISTKLYREMILPFHRRLVDAFSEGGPNSIHLCGDATRHFPTLKEELNIMSFDTGFPVDFADLRRKLGPDVEILGGPSAPFLRDASPEEVRAEVQRILASGIMEGGRFILRDGNNLAPGTPLENLWAMYDTARIYGRYTREDEHSHA